MQETISLYLGLKRGEKADLEVVGLAAAAFSDAVKEIANIFEPGVEIRLEFDSSAQGSLELIAAIKSLKTPAGRRTALLTIIVSTAVLLTQNIVEYGFDKFLDQFFTPEQRQQLSDDDVQRIVNAMKRVSDGKVAKEPARQIFKQLERDETIKSVGATAQPHTKPIKPVPRSDFPTRAGLVAIETTQRTRKTPSRERMTLISPVLLAADRMWRFRSLFGEASYHMKDDKFLRDLLSGRRKLPMKEGIQITADIETHEVFEGGVWVPRDRYITKVVTVHRAPSETTDLFSQPKKPKPRKKK